MQKPKLVMCSALLAALFAVPFVAQAGEPHPDCSSAPHWNSDHTYKKGDTAWYRGWGSYRLFVCQKDKCVGAGANEPSSGDTWKSLGTCDKDPS
jgi:hypothetical protein